MKKTSLAKRNALLSSANLSWGAFALAFALLALLLRLAAPNLFLIVFSPVLRTADAVSLRTHTFMSGFNNVAALAVHNEQLANENAALASENKALSEKVAGLISLSGAGAGQKDFSSGILAGVVARPPESPYDTLVLAAGSKAGIAPGMEAYGAGGVPLGVVKDVLGDFSRVVLFSAPGAMTYGWVGRASIPLTILGAGGGAFTASIARSAGIVAGDIVSVPGPGMLPLGTVVRIDGDPSSPSVTLRIMPLLNPFSVTWVRVRDAGAVFLQTAAATSTLP